MLLKREGNLDRKFDSSACEFRAPAAAASAENLSACWIMLLILRSMHALAEVEKLAMDLDLRPAFRRLKRDESQEPTGGTDESYG